MVLRGSVPLWGSRFSDSYDPRHNPAFYCFNVRCAAPAEAAQLVAAPLTDEVGVLASLFGSVLLTRSRFERVVSLVGP